MKNVIIVIQRQLTEQTCEENMYNISNDIRLKMIM